MPETQRAPTFFSVPAGTRSTRCKGSTCGGTFYWTTNPTTGSAMPIDCSVEGGVVPSEHAPDPTQESLFEGEKIEHHNGRGVLHHSVCPDVHEFSRRGAR